MLTRSDVDTDWSRGQVVDNFLPEDYFESLSSLIGGKHFPWFFCNAVGTLDDTNSCYFIHNFYSHHTVNSNLHEHLTPLLQALDIKALIRVRALQYMGQNTLVEHGKHIDFSFPHKTCVLYLNTNDGFTRLGAEICVGSVRNRALFFDGSIYHNSTNCTSGKRRLVITVNYF